MQKILLIFSRSQKDLYCTLEQQWNYKGHIWTRCTKIITRLCLLLEVPLHASFIYMHVHCIILIVIHYCDSRLTE